MKITFILLVMAFSVFVNADQEEKQEQPNILLVLFDDVGFMGLGPYGSDAKTPNIDSLANKGLKFSQFNTSPLCGPSRAMLMTGMNSHSMGMSTLVEVISPDMEENPSYSMTWEQDQETLASRLRGVGYQTFVSGKWGIGRVGANLPHRFGFDRSFVLDATGGSNYREAPYMPLYKDVKWFEDGERTNLPPDFYSSRDLVEKMISYVDSADKDRPFFGFLSLQAIHIPVQAPIEYIENYNGVFDQGWDIMRNQRLAKAKDLGLIPSSSQLAETHESHRDWNSLSEEEQYYWARSMQVNAGMTEAADFHLGRLLRYLESTGELENTIVVITSDNGAEFNTIGKMSGIKLNWQLYAEKIWMRSQGWDVEPENLGLHGSMGAIGPEWATVAAAPLNLYKFNSTEGGQRVPLIISGPGINETGTTHSRSHVSDITPTLLDAAGVEFDPSEFYGKSLRSLFSDKKANIWGDDSYAFEVSGNASLYKGKWKITLVKSPFGDENWQLFDLSTDPGEAIDLSATHPDVLNELIREYQDYSQQMGIIELAKGETALKQLLRNATRQWFNENGLLLIIVLIVLSSSLTFLIRRRRNRKAK
ncbi:arylsulfatase [Glaciecola petra]|uniref:Arylsulfatase n=1 Tax=Glaciecola petra TaxID=3075602 RepID=A0ABU2ZY06_9ALTE|nr:arylsulfatase [Aestuariibacter sp. P117]MDT0596464.1 arylsulfatase [Aestuariibacter sp. P117]